MGKTKDLLSTFANTEEEVHAIGYGIASGFFGGLTYETKAQPLGILVIGSIFGAALGLKKLERMENSSVVKELHKEPQYALSALIVGFTLGIVLRMVMSYGF